MTRALTKSALALHALAILLCSALYAQAPSQGSSHSPAQVPSSQARGAESSLDSADSGVASAQDSAESVPNAARDAALDSSADSALQSPARFVLSPSAPNLQNPLKLTIESIDEKGLVQLPAMDLRVGESGLVWHRFDENYSSIIARITITSIDSGVAHARVSPESVLAQKYLPTPTTLPSAGDQAYFRTLNNQAFIIAPTAESYEQVRTAYSQVRVLNSDLLLAYLFDHGGFDPRPDLLSKACSIYSVGLLFVITTNTLSTIDCQSLEVLDRQSFPTSAIADSSIIAPFFSRIQYAASGALDTTLKKKHSKQYFHYYDALVKQGKAFDP